jgi:hypothetical protein
MRSAWNISRFRKGRSIRVIALLFLFHAGVDLLFPQLCSEEPFNIVVNNSSSASREAIGAETFAVVTASLPGDSGEERRSDPPRDEDCFCCCTHVMASHGFINSENAELKLPFSAHENIRVPSAPLNNPYHPPRFA